MKKPLFFASFWILTQLFSVNLNSQVTLGSGVGIPVLSHSNINTYLNVTNGFVLDDIIIDGTLEFYDLENLTFINISISGGDIIFNTLPEHNAPIFRACTITGGQTITAINSSIVVFIGTTLTGWENISLTEETQFAMRESWFTDNDIIELHKNCILYGDQLTIDNSPIAMVNTFNTITLLNSTIKNNASFGMQLGYSGQYIGNNNDFFNNNFSIYADGLNGYIKFSEQNSDFYDNTETPLYLRHPMNLVIQNNGFDEPTVDQNIIGVANAFGPVSIIDNEINGNSNSNRGISIFQCKEADISNNIINGIVGTALYINSVNGFNLSDNEITDNSDAKGITVDACINGIVYSNIVSEHSNNIEILNSSGVNIEGNITSNAEDKSILITNSQYTTICDNLCNACQDGLVISGTCMMLEVNDNAMTYCNRGLVYEQDVITNAQIEKGNYFLLNSRGAQYENPPSSDFINAMRYVVRNTQTDYPSHLPANWFQPTGTTALVCDPIDTTYSPTPNMYDVNNLLTCADVLVLDGKCINDMMIALELIQNHSEFLSDQDLDDFNDNFKDTDLDQLPLILELLSINLTYDLDTCPSITVDSLNVVTNATEITECLEHIYNDYILINDDNSSLISNFVDKLDEITPGNLYEANYLQTCYLLIKLFNTNELDSLERSSIIELAESCVVDEGPGVYIAQAIANLLNLSYTKNDSCDPITPRSENSILYPDASMSISSNIIKESIEITTQSTQIISITNISGMPIFNNEISGKYILDVSDYAPGIYFLSVLNTFETFKFVKI